MFEVGMLAQIFNPQIVLLIWIHTEYIRKNAKYHFLLGADFLMRHIKKPDGTGKCYFLLTQEGKPIKVQRTIFSECFYTMAMSELARATKEEKYKVIKPSR